MPPKQRIKRKSSFNSHKNKQVGPPQKRSRLRVQYDAAAATEDVHKAVTKTSAPEPKPSTSGPTAPPGTILIRAKDTIDFNRQITNGMFYFTRMKNLKPLVEANSPIYIYNPALHELAGPYAMEPPVGDALHPPNWSKCLMPKMNEGYVSMRNIVRYVPSSKTRKDRQMYDSRPRIVNLNQDEPRATLEGRRTLLEALETFVFVGDEGRPQSAILDGNG